MAAIVMETITGSNGVIIPPKGYLPGVRKICDEFGIVMICDEVMAGWCRTGKMFAFENFDIKPYFDNHLLSCGWTYSGHPLACAAGVACVNYYKEANILDNVNKVGKVLGEILEELKEKHPCIGAVMCVISDFSHPSNLSKTEKQKNLWYHMAKIRKEPWVRLSVC